MRGRRDSRRTRRCDRIARNKAQFAVPRRDQLPRLEFTPKPVTVRDTIPRISMQTMYKQPIIVVGGSNTWPIRFIAFCNKYVFTVTQREGNAFSSGDTVELMHFITEC